MTKKRMVLALVLAAGVVAGVFAQEKTADVRNNWISGELSLLGAGVRYEYMLNENVSLGLNVYWNTFLFLWNDLGISAVGRFYPWGRTFFAEIGLGYGIHTGTETVSYDLETTDFMGNKKTTPITAEGFVGTKGFQITPGLGWKIDVGKPGGFYISPLIQVPITLGPKDYAVFAGYKEEEFGVTVGFRASFAMGIAF